MVLRTCISFFLSIRSNCTPHYRYYNGICIQRERNIYARVWIMRNNVQAYRVRISKGRKTQITQRQQGLLTPLNSHERAWCHSDILWTTLRADAACYFTRVAHLLEGHPGVLVHAPSPPQIVRDWTQGRRWLLRSLVGFYWLGLISRLLLLVALY